MFFFLTILTYNINLCKMCLPLTQAYYMSVFWGLRSYFKSTLGCISIVITAMSGNLAASRKLAEE